MIFGRIWRPAISSTVMVRDREAHATFIIPPCPSEDMMFVQRLSSVVKTSMAFRHCWVDVVPTSHVH